MAIFNDFAKCLGGALSPPPNSTLDLVASWHRRKLRDLQTAYYVSDRPPIEFGLVNNLQFNAKAGKQNGADVIGLYLGQIVVTANLFSSLLSHPEILSHVGDASAETFQGAWGPSTAFTPKAPIRADYAAKLGWIARNFIVEHEFCHLFNGHVDWLHETTACKALGEVGAARIPGLSAINLQTLEMDADCYGATHTLLTIFRAKPEVALANPFMKTYAEALFAVSFALYSLFRLFNKKRLDLSIDMLTSGDHPPAVMRQFVIGATLQTRFLDNSSVNKFFTAAEFSNSISESIIQAERAFLLSAGKPALKADMPVNEQIINKCRADSARLASNWSVLRTQLLPFIRGRALAE